MRRIGKLALTAIGIASVVMAATQLKLFIPALGSIGRLLLHPAIIALLIGILILLRLRSNRVGGKNSRSDPPPSP
jgi:hypothetical protein